ncbi:MAG: sigma-54 dependent transcriptional regulator [Oceanococcaceae bacterium]
MPESRILVLDKDADRAREMGAILHFLDFNPVLHETLDDAVQDGLLPRDLLAVVLGQTSLGGSHDVSNWLKRDPQHAPVLLMPEHGDDTLGLDPAEVWHLAYPVQQSQLTEILRRVSIRHLDTRTEAQLPMAGPSGDTAGIRRVRHMISQVAAYDTSVLITGESGTGKEVVARAIHAQSTRRGFPFVAVNCGAIPADLLESELFGHEKGAFTGAISTRQGRFELAEGGTLFLDEIGDMSLPMQVKLLRVLQERSFERVGSNQTRQCDVRIVAATHRNLEERIAEGKFREDLYYRLNVFPIETPPLRERAADLPQLVEEFAELLEHRGRGRVRLAADAVRSLQAYPWPGNVRELSNLIERLAVLHPNTDVDLSMLPERYRQGALAAAVAKCGTPADSGLITTLPEQGLDLRAHIQQIESGLIQQALEATDGVVAHAAELLHLRRTTLVEKLRKYKMSPRGAQSAA